MDVEKIVEKIPFFRGLSLRQIQEILHVGQMSAFQKGQFLCRNGDKSREVFVLMSGEVVIKNDDTELARLKAVDIIGEMGVMTGEPRCADIEAVEDLTLMAIPKIALDKIMKEGLELAVAVHKNMLTGLCRKLRDNNSVLGEARTENPLAGAVM